LDGSFYVVGARPRLLEVGTEVTLSAQPHRVERRAGTAQRPIVRLAGIDTRAKAEAVRGQALAVERANAPELDEGEWWAEDLEGCAVIDAGRAVGVVRALLELPSCEALEVDVADGETVLVPLVRDAHDRRRHELPGGRLRCPRVAPAPLARGD
jgi:16S rRNA processing protein RimM